MNLAPLLLAVIATSAAPESRVPKLLDFQATWCGPCQQMRGAIQQLVTSGYPVEEIDIDERPELAERYRVGSVPTYVVVDPSGRELARTQGVQPARQLAEFYRKARARAATSRPRPEAVRDDRGEAEAEADADDPRDEADGEDDPHEEAGEPAEPERPAPVNPSPWKTVVRIKIHGNGMIGFGSGTVIHSTADESIILTCAHIFKTEGQRPVAPSRFANPISVDLFDGVLHSQERAQVHFVETVRGEAIDYDFDRDVGLIRIRPGRRLPASRVVPPSWTPKPGLKMTTVGCSEGNDATAWSTHIIQSGIRLFGKSPYEATECQHAPKQGRSGGGLYDANGYVAGVCDFAEPRGNHGFYATPRSIYHILDKNRLMALYNPAGRQGSGALLAANRPAPRATRPPSIARAQSPDGDEGTRITMPSPEMFGIRSPSVAQSEARKLAGRRSWQAVGAESAQLNIAPEADNDRFYSEPRREREPEADRVAAEEPARASRSNSKWRPVRSQAGAR